ncbi:MAG: lytic transglycosylase domain-containing protein [Opitutaceae bacterium]|nr:lytic transglycosylase domain-containing protein [Opitutaceae bacterium]
MRPTRAPSRFAPAALRRAAIGFAVATFAVRAADTPPAPRATPAAQAEEDAATPDLDAVLEAGQQLWEAYAPQELKAQYEFPTRESVEAFLADLQRALTDGSFEEIAAYEIDARQALLVLRRFEGGDELADWLEPRLDIVTASAAPGASTPIPETSRTKVSSPLERPYWDKVVIGHQPPARAETLVPRLKRVFAEEGVPPEWVWIAEVESSMNPRARSPVGARGLFQFMPATAERFGMSTSWPDERTDPEKSARAAARYLRTLHGTFQSWPLALAAYNAGEGRVSRALKASRTKSFPEVARQLPSETRLYVPRVLATVARREKVQDPAALPAPKAPEKG